MYIKIILDALTLFSINEHVIQFYNRIHRRSYTKSASSIYFKTFPILNCWLNSTDTIILI